MSTARTAASSADAPRAGVGGVLSTILWTVGSLAIFGGVALWAYDLGARNPMDVPALSAGGSWRSAPENEGGWRAPGSDRLVYGGVGRGADAAAARPSDLSAVGAVERPRSEDLVVAADDAAVAEALEKVGAERLSATAFVSLVSRLAASSDVGARRRVAVAPAYPAAPEAVAGLRAERPDFPPNEGVGAEPLPPRYATRRDENAAAAPAPAPTPLSETPLDAAAAPTPAPNALDPVERRPSSAAATAAPAPVARPLLDPVETADLPPDAAGAAEEPPSAAPIAAAEPEPAPARAPEPAPAAPPPAAAVAAVPPSAAPGGPSSDLTLTPVKAPESAPPSPGTHTVQLGALNTVADAEGRWATLSRQHADLLSALEMDIKPYNTSDRRLYRLRVGPFPSRRAAAALCRSLKARDVGCFVP